MGTPVPRKRAGPQSQLHAVGDGAPWIADQVDLHFWTQGSHLVDFFHLARISAKPPVCGSEDPPEWPDQQKDRLKANQSALVLAALAPFVEADSDAPVAACDRYLRNRLDQLDHQGAIQQGLDRIGGNRERPPLHHPKRPAPEPGGRPRISRPCWRSGPTGPTKSGRPIGKDSKNKPPERVKLQLHHFESHPRPTLLIDEADTFLARSDELRGVLNSGHTRTSAYVLRLVGDQHEPRRFVTWGAKAIALIGDLPDTLADRAILIVMRRKLPMEAVERLRQRTHDAHFDTLARRCQRFAIDHQTAIRQAQPVLPAALHDRAQDNWEPLLAIADLAGPAWGQAARAAAVELTGLVDNPGLGIELLRDLEALFVQRGERLFSSEILTALIADAEAPWATYERGRPLTARQLARLLKSFGIHTHATIRVGQKTGKGYSRAQFVEVFQRYLHPEAAPPSTPP